MPVPRKTSEVTDSDSFSMEIGSAYALQVCLLQVPAMVAFSAWHAPEKMGSVAETFRYGVFLFQLPRILQVSDMFFQV